MSLKHDDYRIILFYCYIDISDCQGRIVDFHNNAYQGQLGGRIRVAAEGLNGVLSGTIHDLQAYEGALREILDDSTTQASYELDVKYCLLRPDLAVCEQLFDQLQVQQTSQVVGLVDHDTLYPKPASRKAKKKKKKQSSVRDTIRTVFLQSQSQPPCPRMSPSEWHQALSEAETTTSTTTTTLIDCRNAYESDIGYFVAPNTTTFLTNTRKYSELPQVFVQHQEQLQHSDRILLYCTGGVRCERAGAFLQTLLPDKDIYQLQGGIQKYLLQVQQSDSYFCGKNFCFDPRRYDPIYRRDKIVGRCKVCEGECDHYDAVAPKHPSQSATTIRCGKCRVLLLVCEGCRETVSGFGQESSDQRKSVYCGPNGVSCQARGVEMVGG